MTPAERSPPASSRRARLAVPQRPAGGQACARHRVSRKKLTGRLGTDAEQAERQRKSLAEGRRVGGAKDCSAGHPAAYTARPSPR